jgi:hypothetical protein
LKNSLDIRAGDEAAFRGADDEAPSATPILFRRAPAPAALPENVLADSPCVERARRALRVLPMAPVRATVFARSDGLHKHCATEPPPMVHGSHAALRIFLFRSFSM